MAKTKKKIKTKKEKKGLSNITKLTTKSLSSVFVNFKKNQKIKKIKEIKLKKLQEKNDLFKEKKELKIWEEKLKKEDNKLRSKENDLELKDHKFYSNTDTEILVHLYEEYGENFVDYLDGMFACAIWDLKNKKLIIARDRLGVKPLYYWFKNKHLIFASEIKSILQYEEVKREINHEGLSQFVTYAYTIDGQTLLKDINELLPGHKLTYDLLEKTIEVKKYWDLELEKNTFSENENFEKVKKLLEDAVDKRRTSDAPLGALLSGGLDSSVMVAILNKFSEKPIKTFTTGFGNDLDEFEEAKIVAEHCGTDHNEIMIDFSDLTKSLPKILWHMELPFGRPSILSNYMVSKEIKKFVTVAYTGEGSDELFGGYSQVISFPDLSVMVIFDL